MNNLPKPMPAIVQPSVSHRPNEYYLRRWVFEAFFQGFHELFLNPGDCVEGGAQVAIINPDGTGFQELTSGSGNSAFPSFCRGGHRLVYRVFEKDAYGLRTMDLKTKAVTVLTNAYEDFPLWSPRGDLIMFARLLDQAYEIHTIKPGGTGLRRLTFEAHMAWSPDGESIAFASARMGFKDEGVYTDVPQPYGELFVMHHDGTPSWQPVTGAASERPEIVLT